MESSETRTDQIKEPKQNPKFYAFLEWFFYISACIMTFVALVSFLMVFFFDVPAPLFDNAGRLYWVLVLFYAGLRQSRKQLDIPKGPSRKGSIFLVLWVLVAMVCAVLNVFGYYQKWEIFANLITLIMILATIFGVTRASKYDIFSAIWEKFAGKK